VKRLPKRVEMLAIGDEILDGRVVDTNSVRAAQALSAVGLHIVQRTAITDDLDVIVREAQAIIDRGTELCVVSGGLGPTSDDLTSEAMAKLAGVDLVRDDAQVRRITERLHKRGRAITDNQLKQADRPRGAELIPNPVGTAPGFAVTVGGCRFVSVPGVPHEFDALVQAAVVEPLAAIGRPVARRGLYLFGIIEAEADKRVADVHSRWPGVRLQFRVKFPEIHVTMHAPEEAEDDLEAAFQFAREQLGEHVFSTEDPGFAETVLQLLRHRDATLAVAESCTGGLMCDLLTDVPGSSDVIDLSVVSYANAAKTKMLGVQESTLAAHGAVSEACVIEMAKGARTLAGSTYGLAVSGIAGPGGGTPTKPVGTVWLGLAWGGGATAHSLQLPFDRRGNKVVSAYSGLDLLRRHLLS
jgi:nicotinamide-nucleotide amidase